MDRIQTQRPVRLAEVVASLSLATDLATGQVLEHGLRRALLAVWLGESFGLDDEALSDTYYVALLGSVGCAMEGAAFAQYVQDEIATGEQLATVDKTRPLEVAAFFLKRAGAGDSPLVRARKVAAVALQGPSQSALVCRDVAMQVGEMLDLGPAVREAVGQCHEHWNGKGWPRGLRGEEVRAAARLYLVAHDVDIFNRIGGVEAAIDVVRRRSGTQYDPRIADCFIRDAPPLLAKLESEETWNAALAAEPSPVRRLTPEQFDEIAVAIADFVDSRSTYTLGHSRAVAALAAGAARSLDFADGDATSVYRAALFHDLGRAGVPVTVWEKSGPLSGGDWERVKKHPGLTELVLARSDALGPLGALAGLHHERLDGSGYRGLTAPFLPAAARILAVADAYQSKLEPRPHRDALTPEAAAVAVQREAEAGRLDPAAVRAVLSAAGQASPRAPRPWPADLTDREVEVLRLAARGLSNRAMAEILVVSPKTVGRHIEHIYEKIGVSTRVGATLFAVHHGLVDRAS